MVRYFIDKFKSSKEKTIKILLFTFLIFWALPSFSSDPIIVALDHWPPLIDDGRDGNNGGKPSGIEINILKEVFKRAELKYQFHNCPWTRCLKMAKHKKVGMITHASYNKEREDFLNYIYPAFYEKDIRVFVMRKGEGALIKKFDDLYKYRIGVARDISYGDEIDAALKNGKLKVSVGNETSDLIKLLLHKRVDAFVDTEMMAIERIRRNNFQGQLELSKLKIESNNKLYFSTVKGVVSKSDEKKFAKALESMKKDGSLKRLLREKQ